MHRKNLVVKKARTNRAKQSLKEKFNWPIYFQVASISEGMLKLNKFFAKKKLLTLPIILGSEPKVILQSYILSTPLASEISKLSPLSLPPVTCLSS